MYTMTHTSKHTLECAQRCSEKQGSQFISHTQVPDSSQAIGHVLETDLINCGFYIFQRDVACLAWYNWRAF